MVNTRVEGLVNDGGQGGRSQMIRALGDHAWGFPLILRVLGNLGGFKGEDDVIRCVCEDQGRTEWREPERKQDVLAWDPSQAEPRQGLGGR